MARVNVNLDDVVEYLDPGWYDIQITGAQIKSKQGDPDSQYIEWELTVMEPDSKFDGETVWFRTSISSSGGLKMLKRFLAALEFEDYGSDGFATEDVIGYECQVKVETEEYKGRITNNVVDYRPL